MAGAVLYLNRNIDLTLSLGPEGGPDTLRSFHIVGPEIATIYITREAAKIATTGYLSPKSQITLPRESKIAAGIPGHATHFAFLYPLQCLAGKHHRFTMDPALYGAEWIDALMIGAFVYFSKGGDVLCVNSLTLTKPDADGNHLFLEGPFAASEIAFGHLETVQRVQPVTQQAMQVAELRSFAWVNPGEMIGGHPLCEAESSTDWDYGALVFQSGDPPEHKFIFFRIALTGSSATSSNSFMGQAIDSMREVAMEAEDRHRQMEEELAEWRQSTFKKWVSAHCARLVYYYVIGCIVYGHLEGWHWFDTVYFLTTTATTVGYGDIVPASLHGRAFTALYAPLGCVYVAAAMVPVVAHILDMIGDNTRPTAIFVKKTIGSFQSCLRCIRNCCGGCIRCCCCLFLCDRRDGKDLSLRRKVYEKRIAAQTAAQPIEGTLNAKRELILSTKAQYINVLLGPLLLVCITAAVAYYMFGDDVTSSFYFAVVTMTTVGYGDMTPVDWQSRLALIVLMPIATAALANAVSEASAIATRDAIRNAKLNLVIDDLLCNEAIGDPDASLDKAGFLMATLKAYNLVDDETLDVINAGFTKLLANADFDGGAEGGGADTAGAAKEAGSKTGSSASASGALTLNAKHVFQQHRMQNRIRHRPNG